MNDKFTYLLIGLMFCISFPTVVWSQYYEAVHPGLSGEALVEAVVQDYKPIHVLDYKKARTVLYTSIYNEHDSVKCFYTGFARYLPPDEDNPIFHLLRFGSLNGIITEHTYPKSKGADEGNAKSDMHHLVPARLGVNISRLNHPFGEVPDEETKAFYYLDLRERDIPTKNIDWYSEKGDDLFEPREDQKGNIARAVFYFYTMYREEALSEDPEFFEQQRATLCRWHFQDPVDEKEWTRTFMIGDYQDGKPNPFVLDCSLASRIYCPGTEGLCETAATDNIRNPELRQEFLPNVNKEVMQVISGRGTTPPKIEFYLKEPASIQLSLFDERNQELVRLIDSYFFSGNYSIPVTAPVIHDRVGMETQVRLRIERNGIKQIFTDFFR